MVCFYSAVHSNLLVDLLKSQMVRTSLRAPPLRFSCRKEALADNVMRGDRKGVSGWHWAGERLQRARSRSTCTWNELWGTSWFSVGNTNVRAPLESEPLSRRRTAPTRAYLAFSATLFHVVYSLFSALHFRSLPNIWRLN